MLNSELATDREHLISKVYATDGPLRVRTRTHELYTRPPIDFFAWVLDHISWRGDEVVLDIGCGAGAYVERVCTRLEGDGCLMSADLSMGMLRDVAKLFAGSVVLLNADAADLPLPDRCCDVVLANHMLYHVPQIERAIAEARRVLRPGGRLLAATNGRRAMQSFADEIEAACRVLGCEIEIPDSPVRVRFNLQNGRPLVGSIFSQVEMDQLESALVFPAAEPAVAFINSMRHLYASVLPDSVTWDMMLQQVGRQIQAVVAERGEYRVPKTSGVFLATRAD